MNRHLHRRGPTANDVTPTAVRRHWLVAAGLVLSLLVLYLGVDAVRVPVLTDPTPSLREPGSTSAVAGVLLLVANVVLPVPSSVVMIAHGALFGVAVGTALSLVEDLDARSPGSPSAVVAGRSWPAAPRTRSKFVPTGFCAAGGDVGIVLTRRYRCSRRQR